MTAQSTQPVRNEIPRSFLEHQTPRYTDSAKPTTPSSLLPGATAETANPLREALPTTRTRVPPSSNTVLRKGIEGVVAEIHPETITIQCQIASETVEINLPSALFPQDLQTYGQTVSLSLDYSGGYQRPVVQRRAPSRRELLPGEAELDAWVDTL
jgi:hypothetical protein